MPFQEEIFKLHIKSTFGFKDHTQELTTDGKCFFNIPNYIDLGLVWNNPPSPGQLIGLPRIMLSHQHS